MKQRHTAATLAMTALGCFGVDNPCSAVGGQPLKEETYTITSVFQVLKPADPADMNDFGVDIVEPASGSGNVAATMSTATPKVTPNTEINVTTETNVRLGRKY